MTTKNKPNGSYSTKHGPNGGAESTSASPATSTRRISTRASHEHGRAGSVDASVFSVAGTASQAAGADREATADLAEPAAGKQSPWTSVASVPAPERRVRESGNPFAEVPPGREPLPEDGEAFVDAVHAQVDLVALEVALLRSKDDKVVQRELGCLRELRYGKRAPVDEADHTEIIFDAPRPERPPLS